MASKKAHAGSGRTAGRSIDQVRIDDQKFQQKIEAKKFTDRIEREAKEAMVCLGCGSFDWRMYHKYFVNYVANELFAVMVCRKCRRKQPFVTEIEPYGDEEDHEEEPEPGYYPFGPVRVRRKRRRLSFDQRLRLLRFVH